MNRGNAFIWSVLSRYSQWINVNVIVDKETKREREMKKAAAAK